jgi:hypothetical protein
VEFTARRVEGVLVLLRAMVNQRAAIFMDPLSEYTVNGNLS